MRRCVRRWICRRCEGWVWVEAAPSGVGGRLLYRPGRRYGSGL